MSNALVAILILAAVAVAAIVVHVVSLIICGYIRYRVTVRLRLRAHSSEEQAEQFDKMFSEYRWHGPLLMTRDVSVYVMVFATLVAMAIGALSSPY